MTITLSASNRLKHLRIIQSQVLKSSLLLHHFSTEPAPASASLPKQQTDDDSIIEQAVQLLQIPDHEWNTTQLNNLIFTSSSPRLLFQILRRLPSSSKALKFLKYLQNTSPSSSNTQFLSYTFQAIFELASRENDSHTNLSELYKVSREWNIPLTINSATLLLRFFGRAGLVEESLVLFNELEHCIKNTHVRNLIIDLLLKDGRVVDAFKMLDEMLQPGLELGFRPNDFTGHIVFNWLMKRKKLVTKEEIVELVLKLGKCDVFPDSFWLTQMIGKLCRDGHPNKAFELLIELVTLGAPIEAAPCNALLTGLGRARNFDKMDKVMLKMKELDIKPNVITIGILINHLCKFGRVDDALEVFQEMREGVSVEPDVVIFNSLIDGLCKIGRQEEGFDLMQKMKMLKGCAPNTVTYNCLIDGFGKAGEIERGMELFDEMSREGVLQNAVTVNTLVDGMCRHGRTNSALQFFGEMQSKGLKGDAFAYTSLINAFCNVNNIQKAMEIFHQMSRDGCTPDAMVYYNLISGLSRAGRMDDAASVFSKLKEAGFCPDIVCYNVLIGGFCRKNKSDKAAEFLQDMEETGVKPDAITYNTLISYFGQIGNIEVAYRMMKEMIKDGLQPTVVTYGSLINACCVNGNVDEAMEIFKALDSASRVAPNTVIYNILIDSLCKNNDVELAFSLMDDMRVKGLKPNTTTYNAMFKGLRERKWLKQAFELMDRMTQQACSPDYITMEILTEWLSAVGETEKLQNFAHGYEVSDSTA